jgi:hypothetical protein
LKEVVKAINDDNSALPKYDCSVNHLSDDKQNESHIALQTELTADGDMIVASGSNLKVFKPEGLSDFTKFHSAPKSPSD